MKEREENERDGGDLRNVQGGKQEKEASEVGKAQQ